MARVKRGNVLKNRHRKILKFAKGFRGSKSTIFIAANQALIQSWRNMYRDRRKKKRDFRRLWITRINAACRAHGVSYSVFMNGMKKANIDLNRKALSELAIKDPAAFDTLLNLAKEKLAIASK
ncbi:MAG: 50S ribosomal protein L20 [Candidatus Obscuribacterales bacterium]|nr:50S ribosomal protein L20 [Candidatus Obscuribacterales bacterium]